MSGFNFGRYLAGRQAAESIRLSRPRMAQKPFVIEGQDRNVEISDDVMLVVFSTEKDRIATWSLVDGIMLVIISWYREAK